MNRIAVAVAVAVATVGGHAGGRPLAASVPPPTDPVAYVDAFVAWAEAQASPVSSPACHLPAAEEPPFAVCYGVASGRVVVAVVPVDEAGAPGEVAPLPLPVQDGGSVDENGTEPAATGGAPLPTSFGPGGHEVGGDIVAGTYVAFVPAGGTCYWERVSGFSGELADSIVTGSAEGGALVIVEIDPTDAGFNSDGCGTWTLVG
jgi:hypothetical protein